MKRKHLAALVCAIALTPAIAHAQLAGGGSLDGIVSWVVTTFGRPILSAGIVLLFVLMIVGGARLGFALMVLAGGIGLVNYQTIVGMIGL